MGAKAKQTWRQNTSKQRRLHLDSVLFSLALIEFKCAAGCDSAKAFSLCGLGAANLVLCTQVYNLIIVKTAPQTIWSITIGRFLYSRPTLQLFILRFEFEVCCFPSSTEIAAAKPPGEDSHTSLHCSEPCGTTLQLSPSAKGLIFWFTRSSSKSRTKVDCFPWTLR